MHSPPWRQTVELSSPPARASSPRCHPGGTVVLDSWPPGPREGTSGVYAARQAVLWQSKQTQPLQSPLTFCLGKGNKREREPCFPDLPGPRFHVATDECLLLSGLHFLPGDKDAVLGDTCGPRRPLCGLTLMQGACWAWGRWPPPQGPRQSGLCRSFGDGLPAGFF